MGVRQGAIAAPERLREGTAIAAVPVGSSRVEYEHAEARREGAIRERSKAPVTSHLIV